MYWNLFGLVGRVSVEWKHRRFRGFLYSILTRLIPGESESESRVTYFTTSGLLPIISSLRQTPWDSRPVILFSNRTLAVIVLCNVLSDEKICLSFTIAAGPRQRSHPHVRVSQDSWPYFTVSDSRLPKPGGPGSHIYIPQEEGSPVISPEKMLGH
jgi:hypothetical protein